MGPNARVLQSHNRRLLSTLHDGNTCPPVKLQPGSAQAENRGDLSNFLQLLLISYILDLKIKRHF
mgnify:CR=1|jgi:hypothetical protein